ncbi:hypothetical protein [Imperialibacter sp. 75]|uniref:hypothetical protein n=1 Tax=Imperialibacter sp. 75 TaxID=2768855 RepID=UPI00191A0E37|nr:hypothetical protein [Imperialibacter sp. 75]
MAKAYKVKFSFLLIPFLLPVAACHQRQEVPSDGPNYTLVDEYDGIVVELFDSSVVDENRYNFNNKIFRGGTEFIYSYSYISPSGSELSFKTTDNGWEFISPDSSDQATITNITIKALSGQNNRPEYKQTVISYQLTPQTTFSISGAIENEANLWVHPPRDYLFRILELNPFPYVKFPLAVGKSWNWKLVFGPHWGDERWVTWEGNKENDITYTVTGSDIKDTKWGELLCYEIEAIASSELGETKLTSIFNEEVGFLELNYLNIDESQIRLILIDKID